MYRNKDVSSASTVRKALFQGPGHKDQAGQVLRHLWNTNNFIIIGQLRTYLSISLHYNSNQLVILPFCMLYLRDFTLLYHSNSHYRFYLLNILYINTIVQDILIDSDAIRTPLIDGISLKDPSPFTDPTVHNTNSQIISELIIASGKLPTLPLFWTSFFQNRFILNVIISIRLGCRMSHC